MRTAVRLLNDLLMRAKEKLSGGAPKLRRGPPSVGSFRARRIGALTPKQIDQTMFG